MELAIVGKEKHSFDILAIPANKKGRKRGLWNFAGAKGYEVQASARADSIAMNKDKGKLWGVPMVWVVEGKSMLEGLSRLLGNTVEYMNVED